MGQDNHIVERIKLKQLSEKERYEIEGLLRAGHKASEIARVLGRHRRMIEREISRGTYIGLPAQAYLFQN